MGRFEFTGVVFEGSGDEVGSLGGPLLRKGAGTAAFLHAIYESLRL